MARRGQENVSENMTKHLNKITEQIPGLLNRPFQFSQKLDSVNWKELEELDIDKVQNSTDLYALERLLSKYTYAKLNKQDIDKIADPNMIKLIKLSQLSMEYMQFTQNTMENMISGIDIKYL